MRDPGRSAGIDATAEHPAETDEALAQAAAQGSRHAFSTLVRRHGGRVLATLERSTRDHHAAADLHQEVWIRVFDALPRFSPDRSFRGWLYSIALNAARDEARRRQRSPVAYSDELDPPARHEDGGDRGAIRAALRAVDEPFRTSLTLVDVEGLDYEAAAEALGCRVGTVKSRVSRGRAAFRRHWERLTGASRDRAPETMKTFGAH